MCCWRREKSFVGRVAKRVWLWVGLGSALVLIAGCGAQPPAGPTPTVTLARPSDTPSPTFFPTVIPSATPTPTETPSPSPPPTETPTPTITPTPAPNAQVSPGRTGLRLRVMPSDQAAIITTLNEYTRLTVIGRSGDNVWLQVITPDGQIGWVMSQYVSLFVEVSALAITDGTAPTATPVPTPTVPATSLPTGARIQPGRGGLRLRATPEDDGMILSNLDELTPLIIVGRTADNAWLRVVTPDRITGWVWAAYVDVTIDLSRIPITDGMVDPGALPTGVALVFPPTTVPPTPPPSPTPTLRPIPVEVAMVGGNAQVAAGRRGLRLREAPQYTSTIQVGLDELTPLTITARTADNAWYEVTTPDGLSGWVMAFYVDVFIDLGNVPVSSLASSLPPTATNSVSVAANPQPAPAGPAVSSAPHAPLPIISGVSAHARQIFLRGQELGNQANVFSKVGDSITVASYYLHPFGWRAYNLRDYASLEPALLFFMGGAARDGSNPYQAASLAAGAGWSTQDVLDPGFADQGVCLPGEAPLVCEYRVARPSVALIMLGTNDSGGMPVAEYQANLSRIVEISVEMGVIPVLSTIPPRLDVGDRVNEFNNIIISVARAYDVPLWDYGAAMRALPGLGLSSDGVHPSAPPGVESLTADFSPENLAYGFTLRNLTALQVLDTLYRQVLY